MSRPPDAALRFGGVAAGVIAVSWAAIFIRLADAPALAISAWRLGLAAVPVAAYALARNGAELRALDRRTWALLALSGVALALHFATWIASLASTSVASSVALVTTQPIWVALLAAVFLRERVGLRGLLAIGISVIGGCVIAGADVALSGRALWGDGLALAGAVFAGIYFLIGRRARSTLSLGAYVGVVYTTSAIALFVAALVTRTSLAHFSERTWWMLALLAVIPQLLGHSLLNWALRFFSAPFVSVAIVAEPVISTALAIPFLGEWPGWTRTVGGALTLVGIYLAARDEAAREKNAAPALAEAA